MENPRDYVKKLLDLIKNQNQHEDSLQGLGASVSFLGQVEAYNDGLKKAAKMLANNYPLKGLLNG